MQLGRYQILKKLATGDVADVLLARATGLEGFARHVVIKCIRPELASEERLVQSFIEEARIAASLHHQNIVQVHDIGEQDGAYFFAMEYVHGEDVRQLIAKVRERNEQVSLDHVVAIVTATAAGLHHAHEKLSPTGEHLGLVHRDVCPANILLGYDGSVKLVDFGMAKAALRSTKTASGTLKGKASYMSPEQCMGKQVDRRSDTFALGIVLFELVTARRLFKGASEFLTMAAIVEGMVPRPSTIREGLPPALDEIVLRALAREPQARYQTAEDLRAALERFAIDQQLRTSNKALADYFTALFGQRLEPWHGDSEVRAIAADFDNTAGKGLVAAPELDDDVIARHAPRSTSPIMIAQTLAERDIEMDEEWADSEAHVRTSARRPSQEDMALLRPLPPKLPAKKADEDPYGATLVAPPTFVDEESTLARDENVREAAAVLGQAQNGTEDGSPRAGTLAGTGVGSTPAARAATPTPRAHSPMEVEPIPTRPRSDGMYVGPPAPRSPRLPSLLGTYRRSIIVGAGAGILTVAIAVLVARSCRHHPAAAGGPEPAISAPVHSDGGSAR